MNGKIIDSYADGGGYKCPPVIFLLQLPEGREKEFEEATGLVLEIQEVAVGW